MKNEKGISLVFALVLLSIITIVFTSYLNWYQHQYRQYHSVKNYYEQFTNELLEENSKEKAKVEEEDVVIYLNRYNEHIPMKD